MTAETVTPVEPLPSERRIRRTIQLSSPRKPPRKNAEMVEEQVALAEERVLVSTRIGFEFHEELRQILDFAVPKTPDQRSTHLAKRERGDHDPKVYGKARSIWRQPRMTMAARGESDPRT